MAQSLYPKPSEESETREQSKGNARSKWGSGSKKRKAGAGTNDNFKKVCLCLEVSNLVAELHVDDLEAAKAFVEARLKLKNQ